MQRIRYCNFDVFFFDFGKFSVSASSVKEDTEVKNYKGIELRAKHEEGRIQLQKEKETKERKEGFIMNITNLLLYNGT